MNGFTGKLWHDNNVTEYSDVGFEADIVGLIIDLRLPDGKLYYIINGESRGLAVSGLKAPLIPAVSLSNAGESVRLVRHAPIMIKNWDRKEAQII